MRSPQDYGVSFEFQKSSMSHHRMPLGKPTPSKWDDAQKWLVNLSVGDKNKAKASPRNSNADDRRLIASMPKDYWNGEEDEEVEAGNGCPGSIEVDQSDVETKNVDWAESMWKTDKQVVNSPESVIRSICLRDTGTEMTPIASQEPSRSATPVRSGNGESRSHKASRPSTPVRCLNEHVTTEGGIATTNEERHGAGRSTDGDPEQLKEELEPSVVNKSNIEKNKKLNNTLETRAAAWDEAERAKYMARYKREEVRIQAWENHQKGKAEMEYGKVEAKAERLKSRAQEEYKKKLATTQRVAEEKRANAEAKLREKLEQTGERADHMRRSGELPSSYPFKLPSSWRCW